MIVFFINFNSLKSKFICKSQFYLLLYAFVALVTLAVLFCSTTVTCIPQAFGELDQKNSAFQSRLVRSHPESVHFLHLFGNLSKLTVPDSRIPLRALSLHLFNLPG